MNKNFLESIRALFSYYKKLGEKSFEQLSDNQLLLQPNEASNSVSMMVKHMTGNMLSRWTDFLTSDGEKEWRKRDEEFEQSLNSREEILAAWNRGWDCLFGAIEGLAEEDLSKVVYIRNEGHSVTEAINRQLAHYAYHVGQIVFLAKELKGDEWHSLSIPQGESKKFNDKKFGGSK